MSRFFYRLYLIRKKKIIDENIEIHRSTIEQSLCNIRIFELSKKIIENECRLTCSFESQRYAFEMSKKMRNLICGDLFKYISQFYKTSNPACLKLHTKKIEFLDRQIYDEDEFIRQVHEKHEESVISFLQLVEKYKERYDDLSFDCDGGELLKSLLC